MVARLGHEPVVVTVPAADYLTGIDVFVVEPANALGSVLAKGAHLIDPSLPIVCVEGQAPPPMDVPFAACLVEPFQLGQVGSAIERALGWRADGGVGDSRHRAA
jgi:hypothetical protein